MFGRGRRGSVRALFASTGTLTWAGSCVGTARRSAVCRRLRVTRGCRHEVSASRSVGACVPGPRRASRLASVRGPDMTTVLDQVQVVYIVGGGCVVFLLAVIAVGVWRR